MMLAFKLNATHCFIIQNHMVRTRLLMYLIHIFQSHNLFIDSSKPTHLQQQHNSFFFPLKSVETYKCEKRKGKINNWDAGILLHFHNSHLKIISFRFHSVVCHHRATQPVNILIEFFFFKNL